MIDKVLTVQEQVNIAACNEARRCLECSKMVGAKEATAGSRTLNDEARRCVPKTHIPSASSPWPKAAFQAKSPQPQSGGR